MSKISRLRQHIHSSFRDAVFTHVNVGMNESYFVAFMLALGLSEVTAGLWFILAQFIGVLFQLFSQSTYVRRFSLKMRLQIFLLCQALSFIPLMIMGWYRINSPILMLTILGIYWSGLLSLNPPWTKLMGHTVPFRLRLKFFAVRNQYAQVSIAVGLVMTGLLLHFDVEEKMVVFVVLLSVGFGLKLLSFMEVKNHHMDYELAPGTETKLPIKIFFKRLVKTEQGKLIGFLFVFYVAVYSSSPYFSPYMLGNLKLSYLHYMLIVAFSYLGRVLTLRILRQRARARHLNMVLIACTLGIAINPLLWTISRNFPWLLAIEFFSGCNWAMFELSTVLLYFERIEDHERTSVMSYVGFINVLGMALGSSIGAILMHILPDEGYLSLFVLSSFLRVSACLLVPNFKLRDQGLERLGKLLRRG